MSVIDLIFLGSLCESPKSAYDLQKQVEARNLSRWVKIGSYTAYKKVVQYEKKGYAVSETVKNGNMPEKTVYSITSSGKEFFYKLMRRFSSAQTRVFLDFNAVIVNLALLDDETADACLSDIKNSIQHTKQQIEEQLPVHKDIPLFGQTILKQQFLLLQTLEKWEADFEQELTRQKEKSRGISKEKSREISKEKARK